MKSIEKMLEYLILSDIIRNNGNYGVIYDSVTKDNYDIGKMLMRMSELQRELLESYAINSDSRE